MERSSAPGVLIVAGAVAVLDDGTLHKPTFLIRIRITVTDENVNQD
jgi:hypothetical protein